MKPEIIAVPQSGTREYAEHVIRLHFKPGTVVYTILRHVSKSGMKRVIDVVIIEDNQPLWYGFDVALYLGYRYDKDRNGIIVTGAGMDMGFSIVHNLSLSLFGTTRQGAQLNGVTKYEELKHRWL